MKCNFLLVSIVLSDLEANLQETLDCFLENYIFLFRKGLAALFVIWSVFFLKYYSRSHWPIY